MNIIPISIHALPLLAPVPSANPSLHSFAICSALTIPYSFKIAPIRTLPLCLQWSVTLDYNDPMPISPELLQRALDLHLRFLEQDPIAFDQIYDLTYRYVYIGIRTKANLVRDVHIIETAVNDAFLSYYAHPDRFDGKRSNLVAWLIMVGWRDLQNATDSRLADNRNVVEWPARVEDDGELSETDVELPDDEDIQQLIEDRNSPVWSRIGELLPDTTDQAVARLMLDGVRSTDEYANEMRIMHLTTEERASEVKRAKDRIHKTLKRHLDAAEFRP
jgi:DNA-directed RNA polymerase specialized sigma24 family protein